MMFVKMSEFVYSGCVAVSDIAKAAV